MTETLRNAVLMLLRPLVHVLLRAGVSYAEFGDLARQAFVEVADAHFRLPGRKQSIARVAMLTGIQRKEVSRLRALGSNVPDPGAAAYNRGVRVIAGWRNDSRFSAGDGPLPLGGDEFAELVRAYSGDLPPRAVSDELLRVGAIRATGDGRFEIATPAGYVPTDLDSGYAIMGSAGRDLLNTLAHNFEAAGHQTRLQLTTAYDNLPRHAVERFRHISHEDCAELLSRFDAWLAERDRDAFGDAPAEDGRYRAGIGIYYFEEEVEQ